ncbi:MAG TPA: ATP-grasp fold amidoligase family protein, partial [Acidimicrobiia bacterium]
TRHPITFNDKIHYKMLRDHRPLLAHWADKVAVRDYVRATVGPELLTHAYAVADDLTAVDRAALPRNFVVKVNHACGGVVLVTDRIAPGTALPDAPHAMDAWTYFLAHPDALDWDWLVAAVRNWLSRTYGGGEYREWAYAEIPPKVLVEELLVPAHGAAPADYKLFTFGGKVRIVQVDSDRHEAHRQNLFAPDWTPLPVTLAAPPLEPPPERPATLERMIEIAEQLSDGVDLVRVDLYDVDGRVVFGELTSYPLGGTTRFEPPSFEQLAGSWWHVPRRYT